MSPPRPAVQLPPGLLAVLESGRAPAGWTLLKHGPFRSVLRPPGSGEVWKLYRRRGLRHRRAGVREARALAAGLAARLPAPRLLRHGRLADPAFEYALVLEDLGAGTNPAARREPALLHEVGRLTARLFRLGFAAADLHLGNFHAGEDGRLSLVDWRAVRRRPRPLVPTVRRCRKLYLSLPWPEDRPLRAALFAPLGLPADPPELPRLIDRALARRVQRCLRDSGDFVRRGGAILRRGRPEAALLRRALQHAAVLRRGRRGQVLRTEYGVAKRRPRRAALRLWRGAEALALRCLPHARAQAFLPEGPDAWVFAEDLDPENRRTLDAIAGRAPPAELRRLARALAAAFARLHATGLRFRDPKGGNFVLSGGRLSFVDLDGLARIPPLGRERAAAHDLARLLAWWRYETDAAAPGLEACFFSAYLAARRAHARPVPSPRRLGRRIAIGCEAWRRRHPAATTAPSPSAAG